MLRIEFIHACCLTRDEGEQSHANNISPARRSRDCMLANIDGIAGVGVKHGLVLLAMLSQVSFVDYDLDPDHISGVLNYDPPEDLSVAPRQRLRARVRIQLVLILALGSLSARNGRSAPSPALHAKPHSLGGNSGDTLRAVLGSCSGSTDATASVA